MRVLVLSFCMLHAAFAAPQLITAKDGRIGVNFGGYEAHADIGGALNGNPSGFLGAGASTPHGQKASAGLNGNLNGGAHGVAFANAEAGPSAGRGVVLSGSTDDHVSHGSVDTSSASHEDSAEKHNVIQKIKPPKKYHLIKQEEAPRVKHVQKTVVKSYADAPPAHEQHPGSHAVGVQFNHSGEKVQNALNIPIGILSSLQQSLGGLAGGNAQVSKTSGHHGYTKSVEVSGEPNIVHSALNIPIGILGSLQQSLGGFGRVNKRVEISHY